MANVLQEHATHIPSSNALRSKGIFDTVGTLNAKPSGETEGLCEISDAGVSDNGCLNKSILSHAPNSYKKSGASVSRNFVQLSRSADTFDLLSKDPKAFLLLTFISLRAHREYDSFSELQEGECFVTEKSTPDECGLTKKEYRGAKSRLIKEGLIQEIYNPNWLKTKKGEKPRTNPELEIFKKRAMKRATKCCIVKLCKLDIYDINLKSKGDQKGDQRATKGRPKGDRQEGKEREEYKKKTTPLSPKGESVDDSFSNSIEEEKKHKIDEDVFLTDSELKACLEIHGDLERIKLAVLQLKNWPGRKYKITEWSGPIQRWNIKNTVVDRSKEHQKLAKIIQNEYVDDGGWTMRLYNDNNKACWGMLFEGRGAAWTPVFIPCADGEFEVKVRETAVQKRMKLKKDIK